MKNKTKQNKKKTEQQQAERGSLLSLQVDTADESWEMMNSINGHENLLRNIMYNYGVVRNYLFNYFKAVKAA